MLTHYHKKLLLPALALLAVLTVGLVLPSLSGPAVTAGSWGLHFSAEGEPPTGPATAEALSALDAAYRDPDGGKTLYLTFDAGYENGFTPQLLDVLKAHGVPAAFFLVGTYIEKNPELVARMVREGHTVGNHTQSHPDMSRITDPQAFRQELEAVEQAYFAAVGEEMPKFYRPPQGIYSEENLRRAQALGYRTVFWSLAYADWDNQNQPAPETAYAKLLPRLHEGAVVLLHATSRTNAAILDELLTRWKAMGYRFGTLEELFS